MNLWLLGLTIFSLMLLIAIRLVRPANPKYSEFELTRRNKLGDVQAAHDLRRITAYPILLNLRRIVSLLVCIGLFALLIAYFGWIWAIVISVILILCGGVFEKDAKVMNGLYTRIEPFLLKVTDYTAVTMLPRREERERRSVIGSTEELLHTIQHAPFIDARERELVRAALELPHLTAADVMRPRSQLHTIDKGEVLGPLVIDGLYKTGDSTFLVVDETIDRVVGILPLDKLTGLELTGSPNALNAMDDAFGFIDQATPVAEVIGRLRSGEANILIVQDAEARTCGTVMLNDITDHIFE